MKYVHLEDKTDRILGWYDDTMHSIIPSPSMKVNEKAWKEAVKINANAFRKGKFIVFDFHTLEEKNLIKQRQINAEALKYLSDTDWYVIRYQETSEAIPQDILDARAEARTQIVKEENANVK